MNISLYRHRFDVCLEPFVKHTGTVCYYIGLITKNDFIEEFQSFFPFLYSSMYN
jgi:hypothetical protein